MDEREAYLQAVDTEYSYRLAKKMETFRTNEVLGYRTAGSQAEIATGRMLAEEMKAVGLQDVHMDEITVDSWEFRKAVMRFTDHEGREHQFQLGAYQANFVTGGPRPFQVVDLGKGTAADYEGRDVTGKLVMVDINQREEWWINFRIPGSSKGGRGPDRRPGKRLRGDRRHRLKCPGPGRPSGCPRLFHVPGGRRPSPAGAWGERQPGGVF